MKGCSMSTDHADQNVQGADHNLSGDTAYETAVAEIIDRLSSAWRAPEKPAVHLSQTEDRFPPSRPRRGCEDC